MNKNYDITAEQLKELLESKETIHLIDVREPNEYADDNLGGMLIPLGELPYRLDDLDGMQEEDIYIHCRSGARSERGKQILVENGFQKVHNVLGGIVAYREL